MVSWARSESWAPLTPGSTRKTVSTTSPGTSRTSKSSRPKERTTELISRNQVMAACGNGALKLFDITLEVSARIPALSILASR